jgi:hypothetical protein
MMRADEFDEAYTRCQYCGESRLFDDFQTDDRVCMSCGYVTRIDATYYDANDSKINDRVYDRSDYFIGQALAKATASGARINEQHEVQLRYLFKESLRKFYRVRQHIGRKSYPNYQWALYKLGKTIGLNLGAHVKLPRMVKTMERLIADWPSIDPTAE